MEQLAARHVDAVAFARQRVAFDGVDEDRLDIGQPGAELGRHAVDVVGGECAAVGLQRLVQQADELFLQGGTQVVDVILDRRGGLVGKALGEGWIVVDRRLENLRLRGADRLRRRGLRFRRRPLDGLFPVNLGAVRTEERRLPLILTIVRRGGRR
ncbi:MAG: hypothetical protein VW405_04880 [Rhodospirillaceae bacterium]